MLLTSEGRMVFADLVESRMVEWEWEWGYPTTMCAPGTSYSPAVPTSTWHQSAVMLGLLYASSCVRLGEIDMHVKSTQHALSCCQKHPSCPEEGLCYLVVEPIIPAGPNRINRTRVK